MDDAIIDVENIVRRLRAAPQGGQRQVDRGASSSKPRSRCARAIVYATLIVVLAVMPVFFMEGLSGAFFEPLALAYVLAMLASMVVALTVTPALCLILLRNAPLERRESPLVPWLKRRYTARCSRAIIRAPRAALRRRRRSWWPASRCWPLPRAVAAARRSRSATS